jgi:hypothetical protein
MIFRVNQRRRFLFWTLDENVKTQKTKYNQSTALGIDHNMPQLTK